MNNFDKACAVLAFAMAVVFIPLGVIGLFGGCNAYFTLPPILGFIPALIGWGIVRSVVVAWKLSGPTAVTDPRRGFSVLPSGSIAPPRPFDENAYNVIDDRPPHD